MNEGYYVIRTYAAGAIGEKTKFWVPGARPDRRNRKKEREAIRKQEQNEYSAVKRFARELNANCNSEWDLLGLDYTPAYYKKLVSYAETHTFNISEEFEGEAAQMEQIRLAADRELKNGIRRVKRELSKKGVELKCFSVTSDMDGDTGEYVRVHHHLVVPRYAREAFVKSWSKQGGVDWKPLSDQPDYTAVAEYLLKQVRRVKGEHKYSSSRNLIRPQPDDRIAVSGAELRVPKGGELLYRSAYRKGGAQYIRYILPEEKRQRFEMAEITGGAGIEKVQTIKKRQKKRE